MKVDLSHLPTLADRPRCAVAKHALRSRLDDAEAARKLDARQLELWKQAVRKRDKYRCRCCGIRVEVTLTLHANRAEAHHIVSRGHTPTRYDRRNGVLLCQSDHERLEHNELRIVGSAFFELPSGRTYINADAPVTFRETA